MIFTVTLALNSFCLEICSCLIQSSVEITAAAVFLTMCSGIARQTGINPPKRSDGVPEMCRAIVFSYFLAKAEPQIEKLCRFSWPWVPSCTLFTTQMYFATGTFVCVLFARCFPTDVFLHLSVTTGAENGSSSQGTAGQSGLMAGSTGGVSKAAKGQGSAEKEEQTGNQKRARRQWESWSAEDKNSFFEGLYEVKIFFFSTDL